MSVSDTPGQRPLALVTGASSGIGYELAKKFAAGAFDLVLAAVRRLVVRLTRQTSPVRASRR